MELLFHSGGGYMAIHISKTESKPKKGEFYCMCKLYQHFFKLSLIRNIRYCINDQDPTKKGKKNKFWKLNI